MASSSGKRLAKPKVPKATIPSITLAKKPRLSSSVEALDADDPGAGSSLVKKKKTAVSKRNKENAEAVDPPATTARNLRLTSKTIVGASKSAKAETPAVQTGKAQAIAKKRTASVNPPTKTARNPRQPEKAADRASDSKSVEGQTPAIRTEKAPSKAKKANSSATPPTKIARNPRLAEKTSASTSAEVKTPVAERKKDTSPSTAKKATKPSISKKPKLSVIVEESEDSDFVSPAKIKKVCKKVKVTETIKKSPAKSPKVSTQKDEDSGVGSSVSSQNLTPQKRKATSSKTSKAKRRLEPSSEQPVDAANMDVTQLLALGEGLPTSPLRSSESTSDSEDDDFEEVAEHVELKEPVIPENGVTITLDAPLLNLRRKKRDLDIADEVRKQLKRRQKEIQQLKHKVHLLCWVAHIKHINCILNSEIVLSECHKVLSAKNYYPPKHADIPYLQRVVSLFRKGIALKEDVKNEKLGEDMQTQLCYQFQKQTAFTKNALVFMFVILLRSVGVKARLITSILAVPLKPSSANAIKAPKAVLKALKIESPQPGTSKGVKNSPGSLKKNLDKNLKTKKVITKNGKVTKKKIPEDSEDEPLSKHFKEKKKPVVKGVKKVKKETDDNSDDDFSSTQPSKKKLDRRVLSSDDEANKIVSVKVLGQDRWVEVFLEAEEKWISVDVIRQKVHSVELLYKKATQPVLYVIACNNDSTLKDVTRRYVPHWHSDTRKKRVSEEWWNETLWPYLPPATAQEKEEDEDIARQLHDMPLPSTISEYKAHPLYALKRHLLKFEGIYPPEAPTLGFCRGEPVYARECVVTLRSREIWFKEARVVMLNETPYKIVKARPKYDRMTGTMNKALPLELFGLWQTEDYVPPTAENGLVPRNEYGNVNLFKPCMLPFGTVHLQNPALNRVARKLNIDCAPAVVGFDFHSGGSHPVYDGFVVCEEFKDQLLEAWDKDVEESARRAEEKRDKRIYGNWRRLIRGLIIRENLRMKYAFGENSDNEDADAGPSTEKPQPVKKKRCTRK